MRISTLNKMISMNFPEAVVHYLEDIKEFWSQLLAYNKQAMRMLDNVTVKAVELMAPRHSRRDAQKLHGQLASGQIFAAFNSEDRDAIWSRLRTASGLIPSLFTLFEDLKYLQACAGSMRHLVEPAPGQTLFVALDDKFFGSTEDWDLAYRRLWLYSMEYYSKLPAPPKDTKKNRLAKAGTTKPDEVVLSDFAALASQLGFQSDQISALKERSSDREIARAALLNARKPDSYEYTGQSLESHTEQIIRLFATATPLTLEQSSPAFVSDDPAAAGVRCGFPDEEAHARDAKSLVIANLHAEVDKQGESVTSFFVRKSVYFAFFGRPSETTTKRRSNPAPHTGGGLDLQQERLGALGGGRNVSGQGHPTPQEVARMAQERQASEEAGNNLREGGDASQPTQRNQRRGTHVNLERSIADGLARTSEQPEDPPQMSSPAAGREALVNSSQDLIRTDDVDSSAHGQPSEQNLDRQLQIIPPSSMVRIEFKIYERDVWRTERCLLVDSSDPSEVERVAKKYMRKHIRPFDSSLNLLVPRTCFQAAIADGSNTILLVPENRIQVNNQLVKYVPAVMSDGKLSTEAG
ncbi:hypothetical protein BKA64DRAFT_243572 [Cadophora sp. MPI-SDFR-AT-0126]|nr:hypothetical protein BKA64DRAFT_243572 [Leotiomycetes sp. MPI-SDFR-AT-0126]